MTTYHSRVLVYKCDWCGEEIESSMMTEQFRTDERVCLYCLCKSHSNLNAQLGNEARAKVEERQVSERESMNGGNK